MTSEPSSASDSPALSASRQRFQFGLRGLFLATTVVAAGAFLFSRVGMASLPALIGGAGAVVIHFLSRSIRDDERRQVITLGAYTFTAWLAASILLKHLSQTDRIIAAGSIPAAIVVVWLGCRLLTSQEVRRDDSQR